MTWTIATAVLLVGVALTPVGYQNVSAFPRERRNAVGAGHYAAVFHT